MVLYEIVLIHPETKEVLFYSQEKKPVMPPDELFRKFPGARMVINTLDSMTSQYQAQELKKAS